MAPSKLPADPSLENLKKQAKTLLKAARAGDVAALKRVAPYFDDPEAMGLQGAQLVLAREQGFASWATLKAEVEGRATAPAEEAYAPAEAFLGHVVLPYLGSGDSRNKRWLLAEDLLAARPEIRDAGIHVAAAIGDAERVARWLDAEPALLDRKGGPFGWTPLMYAAYARLPGASSLPAARLLIARGADPDAHFLWGGQYRFTALTGVFGEGEGGPENFPQHPDCVVFARLLLDAGADPNDSQAAYNRMFTPDDTCLELLLEYGLTAQHKNNWLLQGEDGLVPHPQATLHYQLCHAVRRGFLARVRLLAGRGIDLDQPDEGRTPYEWALLNGQEEIAEHLAARGATRVELREVDVFRLACLKAERDQAEAMQRRNPELIREVLEDHPELLLHAAGADNRAAVSLMLDLGFDVNERHGGAALHHAAATGHLDMVKLLLARGADPTLRDQHYADVPAGWADFHGQGTVLAHLAELEMDVFTAARFGRLRQLTALLDAEPDLARARYASVKPSEAPASGFDWMTPLAFAALRGELEAVELLLARGADPEVADDQGTKLIELVKRRDQDAAARLLARASRRG